MTAMEIINSAFNDACTYDKPEPMTPTDAKYTIDCWRNEGHRIPPTLTPVLFSKT